MSYELPVFYLNIAALLFQILIGETVEVGAPVPLVFYSEYEIVEVGQVPCAQLIHGLQGGWSEVTNTCGKFHTSSCDFKLAFQCETKAKTFPKRIRPNQLSTGMGQGKSKFHVFFYRTLTLTENSFLQKR
jgi:hypothetical protein